jgi:hypothetical protein
LRGSQPRILAIDGVRSAIRFVFLDDFRPEEQDIFDFLSVSGDLVGFDTRPSTSSACPAASPLTFR